MTEKTFSFESCPDCGDKFSIDGKCREKMPAQMACAHFQCVSCFRANKEITPKYSSKFQCLICSDNVNYDGGESDTIPIAKGFSAFLIDIKRAMKPFKSGRKLEAADRLLNIRGTMCDECDIRFSFDYKGNDASPATMRCGHFKCVGCAHKEPKNNGHFELKCRFCEDESKVPKIRVSYRYADILKEVFEYALTLKDMLATCSGCDKEIEVDTAKTCTKCRGDGDKKPLPYCSTCFVECHVGEEHDIANYKLVKAQFNTLKLDNEQRVIRKKLNVSINRYKAQLDGFQKTFKRKADLIATSYDADFCDVELKKLKKHFDAFRKEVDDGTRSIELKSDEFEDEHTSFIKDDEQNEDKHMIVIIDEVERNSTA